MVDILFSASGTAYNTHVIITWQEIDLHNLEAWAELDQY